MLFFTLLLSISALLPATVTTTKTPDFCMKYYQKENYIKASNCFLSIYKKSKDKNLLYGAAYALYMGEEYKKSLKIIKEYRIYAKKKGDSWFLEGLILKKLSRPTAAYEAFVRAKKEGIENETSENLNLNLKKVKHQIEKTSSASYEFSLSTGLDSKPYASELGELVTSDESLSAFFGVGFGLRIPIYKDDLWEFKFIYSGKWKIFLSSDIFTKGKGSGSQGSMLSTSSSAFGYSSNDAGFSLKYSSFKFRMSGTTSSFDPFFADNLVGFETALSWESKKKYDQELIVTYGYSNALSTILEPFSGNSIKGLFLQQLPSPGESVTFLSLRGSLFSLGTSENIECDSPEGCPIEIPWVFYKLGVDILTTIPLKGTYLGAGAGYQFFNQLEQTTVGGSDSPFYRQDHTLYFYLWYKLFKSPSVKLRFDIIHNMSNANYLYYDLNYTRFLGSIGVEW
jgi:tetratricopeptide (TPR) repeat protein